MSYTNTRFKKRKELQKNFNLSSICLGNLLGLEEHLSRKQKGATGTKEFTKLEYCLIHVVCSKLLE